MLRDHDVRHGLDQIRRKSFQQADVLQKVQLKVDFRPGHCGWIDKHSHIFRISYNFILLIRIQTLLALLPIQVHFNVDLVCLAASAGLQIYREMNTSDWGWGIQAQHPAGVPIGAAIGTCQKTQLTNGLHDQHGWLLYRIIPIHWKGFCRTPI